MRALKRAAGETESRRAQVEEAVLHIQGREHNTRSLALKLGVSIPTAARVVEALRRELAREGRRLVCVRSEGTWHYEVRDEDRGGRITGDRFVNLVIRVPRGRRPAGLKEEDRDIYGWD